MGSTNTAITVKGQDLDIAIDKARAANDIAGEMTKALAIAGAMKSIRDALTPSIMAEVMTLQGSALGFKTDKDISGGYQVEVVRDCVLEAVMQGVGAIGNQFNIIAGRAYITKEGMGRKLANIKGLSYSITPGIPQSASGGAIVPVDVEWTYPHGAEKKSKPLQICVRVNSGMGADAIIGKATRKARAWLYATITGQEVPEGEVDDAKPVRGVVVADKPSRFEPAPAATDLLGEVDK